jgi:hypothetical protein
MAHKNLLENRTFNIYREIVRGSDLGMERTRRGRGSTRKIFEWGQNGRKGRVQDTNGMLERMKKKNTEKKEREKRVCQWRSGKIKSKRKMDEWRAMWKGQRPDKQGRRERIKESRYNRKYERCVTEEILEYLGERVQKKEKWWRDLDVGMRREKTGIGWKESKEGAEWAMKRERENWAHVEWM